jgi:DNA (cytosine-5)-methyltransferase 1
VTACKNIGKAFYNENEPYVVEWLKNLVSAGHIATGHVEGRSIRDVTADDVAAYAQCHFFAGIGGWSHALHLAGWPDDEAVWTGSCPCQPFSSAGRARGFSDERHLWPEWFRLIRECRPSIVFGEQVGSPDGLKWLDLVSSDLEREGYSFGAADLCAAGVGAPHIRQRLYFCGIRRQRKSRSSVFETGGSGEVGALAYGECLGGGPRGAGESDGAEAIESDRHGSVGELGNNNNKGLEGRGVGRNSADQLLAGQASLVDSKDGVRDFWANAEWIPCRDGKLRPVEPGTFPLAAGVSGRVGKLRAYGNSIVPQVAATFIRAVMQILAEGEQT